MRNNHEIMRENQRTHDRPCLSGKGRKEMDGDEKGRNDEKAGNDMKESDDKRNRSISCSKSCLSMCAPSPWPTLPQSPGQSHRPFLETLLVERERFTEQ